MHGRTEREEYGEKKWEASGETLSGVELSIRAHKADKAPRMAWGAPCLESCGPNIVPRGWLEPASDF